MEENISENLVEKTVFKTSLKTKVYWYGIKTFYKLKKATFDWERIVINLVIGIAFLSIGIVLIILGAFLTKLSHKYVIADKNIILEASGQFGDFTGGVVGTVWSLTGVLLFYATLRLQSKELGENRKHFQMSRLTEIIYKQLDLFNKQLSTFTILDIEKKANGKHKKSKGSAATLIIKHRLESTLHLQEKDAAVSPGDTARFLGENFALIELNKQDLLNIYEDLENHVIVIRAILIKEGIPVADLNELKALFFRNIGRDFLNASDLLYYLIESYIVFQEKSGKELSLLFSPEHIIKRRLETISEFRKTTYDKDTIKQYIKSREMYNVASF